MYVDKIKHLMEMVVVGRVPVWKCLFPAAHYYSIHTPMGSYLE